MSTARERIFKNELKKQIYEQIAPLYIEKYRKAGILALTELREEGTKEWYKMASIQSQGAALNAATHYRTFISYNAKGIVITCSSFVDFGQYGLLRKSNGNVEKWRSKHEVAGWTYVKKDGTISDPQERIDMIYEIPEYLIRLKWEDGITKLPERGQYTDWTNSNFKKIRPMKEVVTKNIQKGWNKTVEKYVEE